MTESETMQWPYSWSPDGKVLAVVEFARVGPHDISMLPLDAQSLSSARGTTEPFITSTSFREGRPRFSPDWRFVAYESDESGQFEIYVRSFPESGGTWQVSNGGGEAPHWSPKGGELFYRSGSTFMAVTYSADGDTFRPAAPHALFEGVFVSQRNYRWYDVFPDGEHFLMMQTVGENQPVFIVNWFEELKHLVPTDN